jgi:hypothetical protein
VNTLITIILSGWLIAAASLAHGQALAASPNNTLAQLGVDGVTASNTGTNPTVFANYLMKTDTNGTLSLSLLPAGVAATRWSTVCFVDSVNGSDTATNAGSAGLPYRTLAAAVSNASASSLILLAPGTYAAPTVTNAVGNLTLLGLSPTQTVVTGTFKFDNDTDAFLNVCGVTIATIRQQWYRNLTVRLYSRASVDAILRQYPASPSSVLTVYRDLSSTLVTPIVGSSNTFDILTDTASNLGYAAATPSNWWPVFYGSNPSNVTAALDQLASRTFVLAPTGVGDIPRWNGAYYTGGVVNAYELPYAPSAASNWWTAFFGPVPDNVHTALDLLASRPLVRGGLLNFHIPIWNGSNYTAGFVGASNATYAPATASDWWPALYGPAPDNVNTALDLLARRPLVLAGSTAGLPLLWTGSNYNPGFLSSTNVFYLANSNLAWLVSCGVVPSNVEQALNLLSVNAMPTGTAPGQLVYWNMTNWSRIAAGTNGQYLQGGPVPAFVDLSNQTASATSLWSYGAGTANWAAVADYAGTAGVALVALSTSTYAATAGTATYANAAGDADTLGGNAPEDYARADATNGFVTAEITNGLLGVDATNGFVTAEITNGLLGVDATNGFVTAEITNGLVRSDDAGYITATGKADTALQSFTETDPLSVHSDSPVYAQAANHSQTEHSGTNNGGFWVGYTSRATGLGNPIAMGMVAEASGDSTAVAIGNGVTASGDYSLAMGRSSTASNDMSVVFGVQAPPYGSHGEGSFNVNPIGDLAGFWVGERSLQSFFDVKLEQGDIDALDSRFVAIDQNLMLNAFRIQSLATISYRDLTDGWVDGYVDPAGVDVGISENALYNTNRYFFGRVWVEGGSSATMHYKMNDNAADTVVMDSGAGGNNGAAAANTADITVSGKINGALSFNGTSDSIDLGTTNAFDLVDFSVMFWLKSPSSGYAGILGNRTDSATINYFGVVMHPDGYVRLETPTTTGSPLISDASLTDDSWHHVCIIRDAGVLTMYVDNVLQVSTLSGVTESLYDGTACKMGRYYQNLADYYFTGALDDMRIYSEAVISDFVTAIYNAGAGTESGGGSYALTNMVLVSTNFTALTAVESTTLSFVLQTNMGVALNTDVVASLSSDDGSNYHAVVLADAGAYDATKRYVIATSTNVTSPGNQIRYKLELTNMVDVFVRGAAVMYK